jgi:hypothetical protein
MLPNKERQSLIEAKARQENIMATTTEKKDPRKDAPKPPFDEPRQQPPGSEQAMKTKPDHGEESYKGTGKLNGRKALITGGDSGIGLTQRKPNRFSAGRVGKCSPFAAT